MFESITRLAGATSVETLGIEIIPESERFATPRDLFRIIFGASNSIATMVLGSLPILLGLGFWHGALAIVVGVTAGTVLLAPMSLFGPINGTNNPVSSGAHFGVTGRILGSVLALLTAVTFSALAIWASGDALVAAAHRLLGTPESELAAGLAYAVFGTAVLTVVVYGFRFMLLVNRIAVVAVTILIVLGAIAFAGQFDAGYSGIFTATAPAETIDLFWPTFIGAALIAMSNPVSYGPFLGDWSRYIPAETPRGALTRAVILSQVATLLPFLFGLAATSIVVAKVPQFADPANANFVGGLVAIAPDWFLLPLILISLVGGMSVATGTLYGTGLDFSSVFPRLTRVQATLSIGGFTVALLFLGRFYFDIVASLSTFASLIVVSTSPWIVIMLIGFVTRRGWYLPEDLQVANRGQRGGAYWFTAGINWRGIAAWFPATLVALLVVNIPGQFVGPWAGLFGSVDASLLVAITMAGALYLVLLVCWPESSHVYGPEGPRFVRARPRPRVAVTGDNTSAATRETEAIPDHP